MAAHAVQDPRHNGPGSADVTRQRWCVETRRLAQSRLMSGRAPYWTGLTLGGLLSSAPLRGKRLHESCIWGVLQQPISSIPASFPALNACYPVLRLASALWGTSAGDCTGSAGSLLAQQHAQALYAMHYPSKNTATYHTHKCMPGLVLMQCTGVRPPTHSLRANCITCPSECMLVR